MNHYVDFILFLRWQSYEVNSRGLEFFSKSWLPGNSHPKALVCCCHSYGDTCTFLFEGTQIE
jgi:acylglycerol lipase